MRLTIIIPDGAVYVDGLVYMPLNLTQCGIPADVRALQWFGENGWIEFYSTDNPNQEISSLPEWVDKAVSVWNAADYEYKHPPAPTPDQIIADNASKAKGLLTDSDWTQLPDVHLQNAADWVTYRTVLREIATNPTVDPVWPTQPPVIWA